MLPLSLSLSLSVHVRVSAKQGNLQADYILQVPHLPYEGYQVQFTDFTLGKTLASARNTVTMPSEL